MKLEDHIKLIVLSFLSNNNISSILLISKPSNKPINISYNKYAARVVYFPSTFTCILFSSHYSVF